MNWSEMPKLKLFKPMSEDGLHVRNTNDHYVILFGFNARFADFWPKSSSRNSNWKQDPFTTKRNSTKDAGAEEKQEKEKEKTTLSYLRRTFFN